MKKREARAREEESEFFPTPVFFSLREIPKRKKEEEARERGGKKRHELTLRRPVVPEPPPHHDLDVVRRLERPRPVQDRGRAQRGRGAAEAVESRAAADAADAAGAEVAAVAAAAAAVAREGQEVREGARDGRRGRRGGGRGDQGALPLRLMRLLLLLRRRSCCSLGGCGGAPVLVVVGAAAGSGAAGRIGRSDAVFGARVPVVVVGSSTSSSSAGSSASASAAHRGRHDDEAVLERGELARVVGLEDGLREEFFFPRESRSRGRVRERGGFELPIHSLPTLFSLQLFLSPPPLSLSSHLHVDQRQEHVARLGVLEKEVAV
jgi:hypothetical protein